MTEPSDITREWYTLRTPTKQFADLLECPGALTLWGGPYRIYEDESSSMLLQRQIAFSQTWWTRLSFDPQYPGEEAGIVVWLNKYSYATISLGCSPEGRMITLRHPAPEYGKFRVSKLVASRAKELQLM